MRKYEKVRPARLKHPKFGVFVLAGRVFRGKASEGAVLGDFFRGMGPAWRSCLLEGLFNLVQSSGWARTVHRP